MTIVPGFLSEKIPSREKVTLSFVTEIKIYLFAFSLITIFTEIFLFLNGNVSDFPRNTFVSAVMGLFLFMSILEYVFKLFAGKRASVFFSILPAALLYLFPKDSGIWPFMAYGVIAACVLRILLTCMPRKETILLFGTFFLDAAAIYLCLEKQVLAGNYITDRLLFIVLAVLTIAALQKLLCEKGGIAFPFYYFLLIGVLLMTLPMGQKPIDWTPVIRAGESLMDRISGLADGISYYLSPVFGKESYTAGYSSLDVTGGRVSGSDRTQITLRTFEAPYHFYRDEETSRDMKMRRIIYLAGGRGADRQKLVGFLRFLYASGADREYAALFSRISSMEVEYGYLETADEIAPADSFLLTAEDRVIEKGVNSQKHKKGYMLTARYIDIDYGSPYLIALFRENGNLSEEADNSSVDDLSYGEACDYMMQLYGTDLTFIMNAKEYEKALGESVDISCTETDGADSRLADLANAVTEGADNNYDKCRLIEKYLRQYRYSTNAVGGTNGRSNMRTAAGMSDIAERFLFETQSGYCVQYTSSMVMLLRLVGIPARAVSGYRYEFPFEKEDFYEVSGSRAHIWPEAYLEHVGWIPFEPTGAYRTASDFSWHRKAADEDSGRYDYSDSALPEVPEAENADDSGEKTYAAVFEVFGIAWPVILSTALLLAILIVGTVVIARMRYRRASPEKRLKMDVEMIRRNIRRQSEDFTDRGLMSDYVERAPEDLKPDLRIVFDIYYRVLYGKDDPGVTAKENELAEKVRKQLADRSRNPSGKKDKS